MLHAAVLSAGVAFGFDKDDRRADQFGDRFQHGRLGLDHRGMAAEFGLKFLAPFRRE